MSTYTDQDRAGQTLTLLPRQEFASPSRGPEPPLGAGAWPEHEDGSWPDAVPADPPTGPAVLIVEDDMSFGGMLARKLESHGLRPEIAISAESALRQLTAGRFDLLIIDVGLPGMSGFDLCAEVRRGSDVPVMFLTGADQIHERLNGFDLGCDDYVVKPARLDEVMRRSRALLRRWRRSLPLDELRGPANIVLRRVAHEVDVADRRISLTPKEFGLLALLLERRQQVLDADTIARAVWGYETFGERNFIERHVAGLRRKLSAAGASDVIATVRGVGYVIR